MATRAGRSSKPKEAKPKDAKARDPARDEVPPTVSQKITQSLLTQLPGVAADCAAAAIFIYADGLGKTPLELPKELESKVYHVRKAREEDDPEPVPNCLRVPNVPLTRMGQLKVGVFFGLSRGIINPGDIVVSLTGVQDSGSLDTIVVTEVGTESEVYSSASGEEQRPNNVMPEVIERVVDIASELGHEGREGKAVGTLFVVGDAESVLPLTRQLIMNPFRGYEETERNILDPAFEETVKELSALDGAFIVRGDGVIETCGAYLVASGQIEQQLPQGLGARHHAAAGITALTDSLAVTVSESTGSVTIFRGGRIVTEIEKPRSARVKRPFA